MSWSSSTSNIEEWVMTTCRDQAPRGGARRRLCEGRRRGRIGRRNRDQRMIHKGTYGSFFRLRLYHFPQGNIDPDRLQRRGGRSATSPPPAGAKNRRFWGGAQGFSDGHGHGHVSCKNLNNYRAKRDLWLLHQVECYVAPILSPGRGFLRRRGEVIGGHHIFSTARSVTHRDFRWRGDR